VISIPGLGAEAVYQQAEFRPETSTVDTTTLELNLVSNDPILDGKLDWTVGAFYMNHEIENHIRGYRDNDNNPAFKYVCSEPFADPGYCYTHDFDDPFAVFGADFDFVTDAYPSRKSYSIYAQTTYSLSVTSRLVSGLRYSKDKFATDVTNFFSTETFQQEGDTDEITGKIVYEYDLSDSAMTYISYSEGFKPGGSNLTFGFENDNAPAMVFPTFESETVSSLEAGLKTDLMDGRARANIAVFSYDYENLQFQATDPDPYRGGVANIPQSEMSGVEIEIDALINDNLTLDLNLSKLDTEVTSDYEVLDNVDAYAYFFGEEDIRYGLRENVRGNMLAKSPESSADLNLIYETGLASGNDLKAVLQIIKRGDFMQRVSNNPIVDAIDSYTVINLSVGIEYPETYPVSKVDLILLNASDKDGVNSSMTDVFGVAATGIELIAPRQFMVRLSKNF
jgi:iron complex outermembrane receptor protein